MLKRLPGCAAIALGTWLVGAEAWAQSGSDRGLTYDLRVDAPVAVGALALWGGTEALKGVFAPKSCRICDRKSDGSDALNALDANARTALRWRNPDAAATSSNMTAFVLQPMVTLGLGGLASAADHRSNDVPANTLVVLESVALAGCLDELVKLLVARERPFVHFRDPASVGTRDPDDNLSFYSGHTTLAFSLAVASGTVASIRGYRLAPMVWAGSLPIAALTGYLRIAADKHYFTDVLTGAALGSAVGFLVPFVFHRASAPPSDVTGPPPTQTRGQFFASSWTF
jgi:membrane-associated phospholipid phosphatase